MCFLSWMNGLFRAPSSYASGPSVWKSTQKRRPRFQKFIILQAAQYVRHLQKTSPSIDKIGITGCVLSQRSNATLAAGI
jgi:hypothetical protein